MVRTNFVTVNENYYFMDSILFYYFPITTLKIFSQYNVIQQIKTLALFHTTMIVSLLSEDSVY